MRALFFIQAAKGGLVCNLTAGEHVITAAAVYGITAPRGACL